MDSNNSRKIMTIDSFREELNHMTGSFIAAIEKYHKMDPSGVVIDHVTLFRHIRQQVAPNGYLVEPNPIDVAAGLGSMFRKVPREMRDIIFGELLASGHPHFLRASKIMYLEGTNLISKHGVYRVNIGFGSKANCATITQQVADTVQNLHLLVDMTQYPSFRLGRYPEGNILKMFSNSSICRRYCSVSFECQFTTRDLVASEVLHSLKSFKEFEEVALSINVHQFELACPRLLNARQWNRIYEKHRHVSLDTACRELEPDLGTAYWGEKQGGAELVFYPRCLGQGKMMDSPGKEKRKWVMWWDKKA